MGWKRERANKAGVKDICCYSERFDEYSLFRQICQFALEGATTIAYWVAVFSLDWQPHKILVGEGACIGPFPYCSVKYRAIYWLKYSMRMPVFQRICSSRKSASYFSKKYDIIKTLFKELFMTELVIGCYWEILWEQYYNLGRKNGNETRTQFILKICKRI